jgi:hypothetical protein
VLGDKCHYFWAERVVEGSRWRETMSAVEVKSELQRDVTLKWRDVHRNILTMTLTMTELQKLRIGTQWTVRPALPHRVCNAQARDGAGLSVMSHWSLHRKIPHNTIDSISPQQTPMSIFRTWTLFCNLITSGFRKVSLTGKSPMLSRAKKMCVHKMRRLPSAGQSIDFEAKVHTRNYEVNRYHKFLARKPYPIRSC